MTDENPQGEIPQPESSSLAMSRDALLAMLGMQSAQPDDPNRQLELPTAEQVAKVEPARAIDFGIRRQSLFAELMRLRDDFAGLDAARYCRYRLLEALFGETTVTVGTVWQRIVAVHGAAALPHFNRAVKDIIASGCVTVTDSQD